MPSLSSLSSFKKEITCLISFFWSSISSIVKLGFRPMIEQCFLKNFAKMAWKVPIQGLLIDKFNSEETLFLISSAALFVNVIARKFIYNSFIYNQISKSSS